MDAIIRFLQDTGFYLFSQDGNWRCLIMLGIACVLLYLGIVKKGFIENLVVFYLENSGHKITLYTKRWFALANHFFLCYNIFRYFSIFGGFLLTLNQYLL